MTVLQAQVSLLPHTLCKYESPLHWLASSTKGGWVFGSRGECLVRPPPDPRTQGYSPRADFRLQTVAFVSCAVTVVRVLR